MERGADFTGFLQSAVLPAGDVVHTADPVVRLLNDHDTLHVLHHNHHDSQAENLLQLLHSLRALRGNAAVRLVDPRLPWALSYPVPLVRDRDRELNLAIDGVWTGFDVPCGVHLLVVDRDRHGWDYDQCPEDDLPYDLWDWE